MRDPFEVLGIPKDATLADAKAAAKRLAKKFHPDAPGGSNEKMSEVNAAIDEIEHIFRKMGEDLAKQYTADGKRRSADTGGATEDPWEKVRRESRNNHEENLKQQREAADRAQQEWREVEQDLWNTNPWEAIKLKARELLEGKGSTRAKVCVGIIAFMFLSGIAKGPGTAIVLTLASTGGVIAYRMKSKPWITLAVLACFLGGTWGTWFRTPPVSVTVIPPKFTPLSPTTDAQAAPKPVEVQPRVDEKPKIDTVTFPAKPNAISINRSGDRQLPYADLGTTLTMTQGTDYRMNFKTGFKTSLEATSGTISLWRGRDIIQRCDTSISIHIDQMVDVYVPSTLVIRSCHGDATVAVTRIE